MKSIENIFTSDNDRGKANKYKQMSETSEERLNRYTRFLKPLALGTMMLTAGMGNTMADQSRSLQSLSDSYNSTDLPLALGLRGRNDLTGRVPLPALEFDPRNITPAFIEHLRKIGVQDPEQLIRNVQQGKYDGETSLEQKYHDKNKGMNPLSSNEEKISTVRALMDKLNENPEALQSFKKTLNDKKDRERSLLEPHPEIARLLQEQSDYTYTQLTSAAAHNELVSSQAFQEATQSLGKQPDWNNVYAYQSTNTSENGIIALFSNEGSSTIFLTIDALNNNIGVLGHLSLQNEKQAMLTWSTLTGDPFAAHVLQDGNWTVEALSKDKQKQNGAITFDVNAMAKCLQDMTPLGCGYDCARCELPQADQNACLACVLCSGPQAIECLKECGELSNTASTCQDPCSNTPASVDCIKECATTVSSNPSACLDVSASDISARVEPSVFSVPGQQVHLDFNLNVKNNCPQPVKDITFEVSVDRQCPSDHPLSSEEYALFYNANQNSADVGAFTDAQNSTLAYCLRMKGFSTTADSSSLPIDLSVGILASGTDSTTNSTVSSQEKIFTVLGSSPWTTNCDLHCPQPSRASSLRRLGTMQVLLRSLGTGIPLAYALAEHFRWHN